MDYEHVRWACDKEASRKCKRRNEISSVRRNLLQSLGILVHDVEVFFEMVHSMTGNASQKITT